MKRVLVILISIISIFLLTGCVQINNDYDINFNGQTTDRNQTTVITARPTKPKTTALTFEPGEKPQVEIKLSNGKSIKVELYPDVAPISVRNFITLAESGFYDGLVFHRVIANFMIQTGGYEYTGHGTANKKMVEKDAETIVGEVSLNGYTNDIKHVPGVISMARANAYNSGSSQFFICVADYPSLDGSYAAFGKTIDQESLDNAIEISKKSTTTVTLSTTSNGVTSNTKFADFPVEPIYIVSVRRIDK